MVGSVCPTIALRRTAFILSDPIRPLFGGVFIACRIVLFADQRKQQPTAEDRCLAFAVVDQHHQRAAAPRVKQQPDFLGKNWCPGGMVMTDDPSLRLARLRLLRRLEALILKLADISQIVPEDKQA